VASLVRGMGGDGHGSQAACHGSLVESGKIMHGFALTRYYEVKPLYVIRDDINWSIDTDSYSLKMLPGTERMNNNINLRSFRFSP